MQRLAGSGAPVSLALTMERTSERLDLNGRGVSPLPALPSPSSLRDATSPKVRGLGSPPSFRLYTLRPAAAKKPKALRSDFPPLLRAPPLGELDAVRRPERASPAEAAQGVGLAGAYDGADFRKPRSERTRCVLVSGLALSVIASRCHLSQSERPWQSAKFPVWNLYALLPQGEPSVVTLRLHAFAKGSPFGRAGRR